MFLTCQMNSRKGSDIFMSESSSWYGLGGIGVVVVEICFFLPCDQARPGD